MKRDRFKLILLLRQGLFLTVFCDLIPMLTCCSRRAQIIRDTGLFHTPCGRGHSKCLSCDGTGFILSIHSFSVGLRVGSKKETQLDQKKHLPRSVTSWWTMPAVRRSKRLLLHFPHPTTPPHPPSYIALTPGVGTSPA